MLIYLHRMVSDEKLICSSIAMLQERFRQLEKVKEMREERELLKLISSPSPSPSPSDHIILFPTPNHHAHELLTLSLSLSLWPNSSQMKQQQQQQHVDTSYWDINIQNTQQHNPSWLIKNKNVDSTDVDTTLHL
ncbi:hypothetical protein Hanom_Chr05g00385751 [Helianthus anomalus]